VAKWAGVSDKRKQKAARRAARKHAARKKQLGRAYRDASGRTHLVVHRDPLGNVQGLTLAAPLFRERWQNEVATGAANTSHGMFASEASLEAAVALGQSVMEGTSTIVDGVLARAADGQRLACQLGCAHCCYQPVGVTAPEVFAIHDHLRARLSPDALAAVAERVHAADASARGKSAAERLSPELPCPFLQQDRCSIYEVRPLACRGKNSLDAEACERTLHDPSERAALLAGQRSVPCFLEPIRAFHAVSAGLQLALHELYHLRVAPLDLTAAMRVLLDDPEGVPERWLRGEDPFQAARGADVTGDPLIRELSGSRSARG